MIHAENEELFYSVVKRRLQREGLTGFRNLYRVPEYIPDEQVEKWVVKWVGRRYRLDD